MSRLPAKTAAIVASIAQLPDPASTHRAFACDRTPVAGKYYRPK